MRFARLSLRSAAICFLAAVISVAIPAPIGPADGQRYLSDIKTLTEARMEGRGDGTKGLVRAEHFLASRY